MFRAYVLPRSGRMTLSYLVGANHDVAMFESADIVAYRRRTYEAPVRIEF